MPHFLSPDCVYRIGREEPIEAGKLREDRFFFCREMRERRGGRPDELFERQVRSQPFPVVVAELFEELDVCPSGEPAFLFE